MGVALFLARGEGRTKIGGQHTKKKKNDMGGFDPYHGMKKNSVAN